MKEHVDPTGEVRGFYKMGKGGEGDRIEIYSYMVRFNFCVSRQRLMKVEAIVSRSNFGGLALRQRCTGDQEGGLYPCYVCWFWSPTCESYPWRGGDENWWGWGIRRTYSTVRSITESVSSSPTLYVTFWIYRSAADRVEKQLVDALKKQGVKYQFEECVGGGQHLFDYQPEVQMEQMWEFWGREMA
jgi:hypothetical protein